MLEASDIEAGLDAGLAHHEAGRLTEAEAIYRKILEQEPDHPDALNLLGVILQDSGDLAGSIAVLSHAVAVDPEFPEALVNLARAQCAADDPEAAKRSSEQAIELDPELADGHLQLARSLLALQDDAAAVTAATRAISLAPDSTDAQLLLGHAHSRLKNYAAAAAAYEAADRLAPNRYEILLGLGSVLAELRQLDDSLRYCRRAAALKPDEPHAYVALGGALRRAEDLPGSVEALNRAFELAPERPDVWLQQGDNYALMGQFDAAAECYDRILARNPASSEALARLTAIGKQPVTAGAYGPLRAAFSDTSLPMAEREAAGFALGALLDKAGDYEAAFFHYAAANRLAREVADAAGNGFDLVQFRRRVNHLKMAFDPPAFAAAADCGDPSEVPVFIVGMPRSGTTLVEQILASHPKVHGAGERKDIFEIAERLEAGAQEVVLAKWDQSTIRHEASTQLARLRALGRSSERVIDKLPDNILQLGHIAVLFPNARIIICGRDPRDICLSCFLQHFRDGMPWTSDLTDVAARASEVLRLADHWRDVLPLRILDVQYETLVDDLEGESRRMIDFLGLDWDDACLSFHKTERAVQTASFWQVRQKLYSSSVGRWRHYRPYIQPLLDGLLGLIPVDGDALPVPRILVEANSLALAGHLVPAESAYRLVVERQPANPEALFRLGQLVRGQGDPRQAVSLLRRAVDGRPGDGTLLVELARAYRQTGDFRASAKTADEAAALDPNDASAQFLLGSARLELNDAVGAKDILERAIELAPESADAHLSFAMACMRLKEFPAAAAALRDAVRLRPDDPECLAKLGRVLCELSEYREALPSLHRAIALAPEDGRVHLALVTALWGTRDVAATDAACDAAIRVAPEMAELWVHSGHCKAALGRFTEAADCYRKAIALEPDLDTPRYGLVYTGHQGEVEPDVARLRNVLADRNREERERIAAGYALGAIFDRTGDYDAAWSAYAVANQLAHASHQAAGCAFDPAALDADIEAIIANFSPEAVRGRAGQGNTSDRPVFVVGMPRSGTTLVEQIAASHPDVFGAGELDDISEIVARIGMNPADRQSIAWEPATIANEFAQYLRKLGELGRDAKRVIDKMPDNFLWLGHIAALFPNARVIICRRDARDVGLSCYSQHFGDNLPWTTSLADIAWRTQAFERLVSHWRTVLSLAILDVQYEDLVHNLEPESRRLVAFLGLDWDPACLAFHETERAVMTASQWQVRQPLFTRSIGRWQHYRGHLQPLVAGLAGLIPSEGDENWDSLAATPTTALTIAKSHHRAGRLGHAEPIYRALLRHNPDDPTALHLLGLLLMDRETPAESVALLNRALALRPDAAPVLASLARAYCAAGDADAAVATAQRAMASDPALPDPLVQLGYALLLRQDYPGAIEALRRATEMAPRLLEAWIVLATALTGLKDHQSAAKAWQMAVALKPNDARLLTDLAGSLVELRRNDEAGAALRQAAVLAPDDQRVQYAIAHSLLHGGETAAALDACQRALKAAPDWARMWLLLANCEAMRGHFDAAAEAYRRTLTLEPGLVDALHDLVLMGGRFDDEATKQAVRDVLDDAARPVRDRIAAGFSLGQVCDRSGAYDEAFDAFALANRLLRDDRVAHGFVFDRNQFRASIDRLIAAIDARTFADTVEWGDPSELPVFIVGMPRSGTSLVEQIAASHPSVFGAGEQGDMRDILAALDEGQMIRPPAVAWDRMAVRHKTAAHLQHLRHMGGDAIRVIDKQPDNILRLGQIAVLFPRARIVVCRRDLRDVGLSCFVQYFREDELTWTDDLADCAFRAREIERLMDHWRKVLPCPILEVDYETLVANLESESRRLIDFLGLEWDPACLAFHETERTVMTASLWQVRQPLYASSVGRWRHYRQHLQPLIAGLAGLVSFDGEEDWDTLAADPVTALTIGMSHYQGGRLDHAESIYRAVLRRNPDEPAALHLLGLLVLDSGEPAEAVALMTRSLTLRPDIAPVLADLSGAHRAAGDAKAAVEAARHAVAIDPALPVALVQLGYALLMQEDAAGAVQVLRQATDMAPGLAQAWLALATALTRQGDHGSAIDAWEAALTVRPDDPGLLTELAAAFGELRRFDEALAAYRQADAVAPGNPRVRYGIAASLMHRGDIAAATETCRLALEATPDARFWLLLANCEAASGHFEAAADACRQALARDPGSAGALHDLVALGQRSDDDAVKHAARDVLDDLSRPVRDRVSAGFALGQVYDRYGAYDEAFEAYAQANRLLRDDRHARGFAFDRARFRDLVDRQIAMFDTRTFDATAEWGDPSEQPVFVVGMPRSGTSLVEQIAASHKLVFGAGEQTEMLGILTVLDAEQESQHQGGWKRSSVRREAMAYVERLRGLGGTAERIIDKQPDNILCLGQIATLFPRARIVVCRRDPRDVSLSCFFQYFRNDLLVWTDDQADCAFRALEIDRLTDHWRAVLPCPILEVQYETLVADLEGESRRLIDFLGLEWDPACLTFHETERTVMTASHWQVRQPVYASSVGRWRHYQDHIGPLLRELSADSA